MIKGSAESVLLSNNTLIQQDWTLYMFMFSEI